MEFKKLFEESQEARYLRLPGVKLEAVKHNEHISDLNSKLTTIFKDIAPEKSRINTFLGSHPKSLTRKSLKTLSENPVNYLVCEKSDGIRYLLIVTNLGECFLSSRNEDYHLVKILLPKNLVDDDEERKINFIFDGELILDTFTFKNEQNIKPQDKYDLCYLIFDCIVFNGQIVTNKNYDERLEHALRFISIKNTSRELLLKLKPKEMPDLDFTQLGKRHPISIYLKDFFQLNDCRFILNKFVAKLPHHNDGLIFTQTNHFYEVGPTDSIIKWKEPHQNTADFLIVNNFNFDPEKYGRHVVDLYVSFFNRETKDNDFVLFDYMIVDEEFFDKIGEEIGVNEPMDDVEYKNKTDKEVLIAECKFDSSFTSDHLKQLCNDYIDQMNDLNDLISLSALCSDQINNENIKQNLRMCFEKKLKGMKGNWVVIKFRTDKKLPNGLNTAQNVFNSITENVTKEEVFEKLCRKLVHPLQPSSQQIDTTSVQVVQNDIPKNLDVFKPTHPLDPGPQKKLKKNVI